MAIPILNHLDLQKVAEIKNTRVHNAAETSFTGLGTGNKGLIIIDGTSLKFYDGSSWQTVGTSSGTMSSFTLTADSGTNQTIDDAANLDIAGGTGISTVVQATDTVQINLNEATSSVRGGIELFSDTDQSVAANAVSSTSGRTYGIQLNSSGQAVVNVPWTDTDTVYTLPLATSTVTGGVQLFSNTDQTVAANSVTTTAGRTYGVQLNSDDQMVVNVPWTDTNTVYTHPTHAGDDIDIDTGPLTGATVISDLDFNVTTDTLGHVTDANATIQTRALTLADLGYTGDTDANNYSLPLATSSTRGGVKIGYTENGKNYPVELDSEQMYVNVPWTDTTYTLPTASPTVLGGVKVGSNLTIDGNGVLNVGAIALTTIQTAANQSAMLGLTTQEGDVVVRTDENKTYMHNGGSAGTMADFTELISPTDGVSSLTTTDGTYINLSPNSATSGAVTVTAELSASDGSNTGTSQRFLTKDNTWAVPAYTTNTDTTYSPGDGLDLSGTTFSVDLKANGGLVIESTELAVNLGASSITGTLSVGDGGTGATTASGARTNLGVAYASAAEVQTGTLGTKVVTPDTLAAKSVVADITAASVNSSNLYAEVTHNLGTADIVVQIYDKTTEATVFADVFRTDKSDSASTSKIKIVFAAVPSNDLRVVITSVKGATAGSVAYT
jgi:hypothetical protein